MDSKVSLNKGMIALSRPIAAPIFVHSSKYRSAKNAGLSLLKPHSTLLCWKPNVCVNESRVTDLGLPRPYFVTYTWLAGKLTPNEILSETYLQVKADKHKVKLRISTTLGSTLMLKFGPVQYSWLLLVLEFGRWIQP
jgi:hypothetical protein